MPMQTEQSPLLGLKFIPSSPSFQSPVPHRRTQKAQTTTPTRQQRRQKEMQNEWRQFVYAIFLSTALLATLFILKESTTSNYRLYDSDNGSRSVDKSSSNINNDDTISEVIMAASNNNKNSSPFFLRQSSSSVLSALEEELSTSSASSLSSTNHKRPTSSTPSSSSPYTKVQTLSFQIYTGGAPALIPDETNPTTLKKIRNHECRGLHSYGKSEDDDSESPLQCYLGMEDTALDVEKRLNIMRDAVNKAYDVSVMEESTLKIFLAPEFFFRGKNGSFEFQPEEKKEANGKCGDICHILKGLEDIVADERFENWLFLFGTVIGSEVLPKEDEYDYQFYNFAPLYKGFDPAKSKGIGKNFIVPKRYVSNIDFLTPLRHLSDKTNVMELLDDFDSSLDRTLANPHISGHKRYDNDMWLRYKDELTALGYNMIEYGWFFLDGIAFSVEICLDHLVHRSLMTYMADVVTGSNTRIPSSANDVVDWVGIPRTQAQISLVSSAGMDVTVSSLALANGGHIFLQDGMEGDIPPHSSYGTDECSPNEYVFFGGSQSITRTAVVSPTDVTFEYVMNLNFSEFDLYPEGGDRNWKHVLKGVFSSTAYQPKLTVYDPINITITSTSLV